MINTDQKVHPCVMFISVSLSLNVKPDLRYINVAVPIAAMVAMIRPVMSSADGCLLKYLNTYLTIDGINRNNMNTKTAPKICLYNGILKYIALYALSSVSVVAMNTSEDRKELLRFPFRLSRRNTPIDNNVRNIALNMPNSNLSKMGSIMSAMIATNTIDRALLDSILCEVIVNLFCLC